jgi:hypothetical protein
MKFDGNPKMNEWMNTSVMGFANPSAVEYNPSFVLPNEQNSPFLNVLSSALPSQIKSTHGMARHFL